MADANDIMRALEGKTIRSIVSEIDSEGRDGGELIIECSDGLKIKLEAYSAMMDECTIEVSVLRGPDEAALNI